MNPLLILNQMGYRLNFYLKKLWDKVQMLKNKIIKKLVLKKQPSLEKFTYMGFSQ